jgi:SAM-dependent methyltransferase
MLCFQYYGEWESFYVIDKQKLRGATVLDVGAGCGETAAFYFEKGAKKVICVESDPRCVRMLEFNRLVNDWNLEIVHSAFDPTILGRREVELAKFDCEGCERSLPSEVEFDIVGEIHGERLLQELKDALKGIVVRKALPSPEYGVVYYFMREANGTRTRTTTRRKSTRTKREEICLPS